MFLLGFFWRRTTAPAAMFATVGGLVFSIVLKFLPDLMDLSLLAPVGFAVDNGSGVYEIPFLDRKLSHVEGAFAFGSAVVCVLLAMIYGA
jgi:SSS family solute:Na+ symporter